MTDKEIPQQYIDNPNLVIAHIRDLEMQLNRGYLDIKGQAKLRELKITFSKLKEVGMLK